MHAYVHACHMETVGSTLHRCTFPINIAIAAYLRASFPTVARHPRFRILEGTYQAGNILNTRNAVRV